MGVPRLFKTLVQKYRDILVTSPEKKPTHLFFDLNCLIHPVCATCENHMPTMFEKIKEYIIEVVSHVNSSAKVFLFMDGVAPFAKVSQQRQRRFKSLYLKKLRQKLESEYSGCNEKADQGDLDYWDSNAISPDTFFMRELEAYLVQQFPTYKISGTGEPGEGEHKILEYILLHRLSVEGVDVEEAATIQRHTMYLDQRKEPIICIYGLDADLILLSWIICLKKKFTKVYLVREAQYMSSNSRQNTHSETTEKFTFLHINRLMASFYRDLNLYQNRELECCDFILISFFLGNDFLPNLFGIQLGTKPDGLSILLENYKYCKKNFENFYLVSDKVLYSTMQNLSLSASECIDEINWQCLTIFFENLQKQVTDINANFLRWYLNFHPRGLGHDASAVEQKMFDFENKQEKSDPILMCQDGWQQRYCKRYFFCDLSSPDAQYTTGNYASGLLWNLKYYFKTQKTLSFGYVYPYIMSPTIEMFYLFLKNQHNVKVEGPGREKRHCASHLNLLQLKDFYKLFVSGPLCPVKPLAPQVALKLILPPESFRRVAACKQSISKKEQLEADRILLQLDFDMDYKHYWNECHMKLPPIEWMGQGVSV